MKLTTLFILFSISHSCFSALNLIEGVTHKENKVRVLTSDSRGTVLVFLSVTCPCSDSHIEEVKRLKKKYKEFKFVGIHSNYAQTKEEALAYFPNKKLGFDVIHDMNSEIAKKLGAVKTPHSYILNRDGEVIYRGGVTNRSNASKATKFYLDEALSDLRAGHNPRVEERKTLGCYIEIKD
jgi:thioredoxin-related protein